MAIDSFATIWSARIFENWRKIPGIYRPLVSDVSDQVIGGNKVNLTNLDGSSITTSDYAQDTDINVEDTPVDTDATLELSNSKYQNIYVDDLAEAKTQPTILNNYAARGAEKMSLTIDNYIKAQLLAGIGTTEKVNSGFLFPADIHTLTDAQAKEFAQSIISAVYRCDINNWPVADRRCVISPGAKYALTRYLLEKGVSPSDSVQGGGLAQISSLLGMSTSLDSGIQLADTVNDLIMIITNSKSLYFAQTINSVETYRPEKRFGTSVKWLSLYGAKKAYGTSDKNVIIVQASA